MVFIPQYEAQSSAPFAPGGQVGVDDQVGQAVETFGGVALKAVQDHLDEQYGDQARAGLAAQNTAYDEAIYGSGDGRVKGFIDLPPEEQVKQGPLLLKALHDKREAIAAGLPSQAARRLFDAQAPERDSSALRQVTTVVAASRQVVSDVQDDAAKSAAATSATNAARAGDPVGVILAANQAGEAEDSKTRRNIGDDDTVLTTRRQAAVLPVLQQASEAMTPQMAYDSAKSYRPLVGDDGVALLRKRALARLTTGLSTAAVEGDGADYDTHGDTAAAAPFAAPPRSEVPNDRGGGAQSPGKDKGSRKGGTHSEPAAPPTPPARDEYGRPTPEAAAARAREMAAGLHMTAPETKEFVDGVIEQSRTRHERAQREGDAAFRDILEARRAGLSWPEIERTIPGGVAKVSASQREILERKEKYKPPHQDDRLKAVQRQQQLTNQRGQQAFLAMRPEDDAEHLTFETLSSNMAIAQAGRDGLPAFREHCDRAILAESAAGPVLSGSMIHGEGALGLAVRYDMGRWVAAHAAKTGEMPTLRQAREQARELVALHFHASGAAPWTQTEQG